MTKNNDIYYSMHIYKKYNDATVLILTSGTAKKLLTVKSPTFNNVSYLGRSIMVTWASFLYMYLYKYIRQRKLKQIKNF